MTKCIGECDFATKEISPLLPLTQHLLYLPIIGLANHYVVDYVVSAKIGSGVSPGARFGKIGGLYDANPAIDS